jgi:hypothetical protein
MAKKFWKSGSRYLYRARGGATAQSRLIMEAT